MQDLLGSPDDLLGKPRKRSDEVARYSRAYRCRCGNRVYFRNTLCLVCKSQLGYLPDEGRFAAFDPGPAPGTWRVEGRSELAKFCANRNSPAACNWTILARNPRAYCIACRLNRTIPNLQDADNGRYWRRLEVAKRRLVSQLIALNLPITSKVDEDPERGLMFDFLRSPPEGPRVLTGHANGLITINVEEADDVKREQIKYDLHESLRDAPSRRAQVAVHSYGRYRRAHDPESVKLTRASRQHEPCTVE